MSSVFFTECYCQSIADKPADALKTVKFGMDDLVRYV
jgi:hypothetical protein